MNRLIWLDVDLRAFDNPLITVLPAKAVDTVYAFYNIDLNQSRLNRESEQCSHDSSKSTYGLSQNYGVSPIGSIRRVFLADCLKRLADDLMDRGIKLITCEGNVLDNLGRIIAQYNIHQISTAFSVDFDRLKVLATARRRWSLLDWSTVAANTLLPLDQFSREEISKYYSKSFSHFRRQVEKDGLLQPIYSSIENCNPLPSAHSIFLSENKNRGARYDGYLDNASYFDASEMSAQEYLYRYFSSAAPQTYKQTRNNLFGDDFSTRLSVYLSRGLLSVRQVLAALRQHESEYGDNESTRWIEFELLWRDYFYGYALLHGKKLFLFGGITGNKPLTSYYAQRFKAWCAGNTPWPLVNAAMKELVATGWISNRARQIVASALINELQVDWRYGAAFFQHSLLDYDVAINWGNWQYIAGVGADPRGGRHFNLAKQQSLWDPEGAYVDHWGGASSSSMVDSVDAADWPSGSGL